MQTNKDDYKLHTNNQVSIMELDDKAEQSDNQEEVLRHKLSIRRPQKDVLPTFYQCSGHAYSALVEQAIPETQHRQRVSQHRVILYINNPKSI